MTSTPHHLASMSSDEPRGYGVRGDVRKRTRPEAPMSDVISAHIWGSSRDGEWHCRCGDLLLVGQAEHIAAMIRAHYRAGGAL